MTKNIKHGHGASGKARTPTYTSWDNMIARCHNPNNKRYADYGGAGITVCPRWRLSFASFLSDLGEKPEGHQIDRIDNELGYEPSNCRWATPKQNMANRSVTKLWTVHGVDYLAAADAARFHGCSPNTVQAWCKGRTAKGRHYPPRPGCSVQSVAHARLREKGIEP